MMGLRITLNECKRVICTKEFIVSCMLGVVACVITLSMCGTYLGETIHKFMIMEDKSVSFLSYIIAILPCASCIYDDMKNKNIYSVLGRISMKQYLMSKVITAVLVSIVVFMIGKMVFIVGYSIFLPMGLPNSYEKIPLVLYGELIREGHFFSYMFLVSLQRALYSGVLCLIVIVLSIFIPNKSLMYSVPIAIFYVANYDLKEWIQIDFINYPLIYHGTEIVFSSSSMNFLYAVLLAVLTYVILYCVAYKALHSKIHGVGWI